MVKPYIFEKLEGNKITDITKYIISVDKFTDVGTGEIVSAKIMLAAKFGDFLTQTNNDTAPIIHAYDLFRLTVTDVDGNSYKRKLITDDRLPQKTDHGRHIILELFGRERFLQKMLFPGHFYFISFKDMVKEIISYYNNNKGTEQPEIIIKTGAFDFLDIPSYTYGTFDFGDETTCYDALMAVIGKLSLSVAAGGAGEFYSLEFDEYSTSSKDLFICRIFPEGSIPSSPPMIKDTISLTRTIQAQKGNIIIGKGKEDAGTLPKQISMWRSLIEEYTKLPLWSNSIEYEKDAMVNYQDKIYRCIKKSPAGRIPTSTSYWILFSFSQYIGNNFEYSPWTANKAAVYKNYAGNPTGPLNMNFSSPTFPDCNLVIRDKITWRSRVDFRVRRLEDIPTQYLYKATAKNNTIQSRTYEGMRLLIDSNLGSLESPFNGSDKFGVSYSDTLVQQDRDGDWIVFRRPERNDQCAVEYEGKMYEFQKSYKAHAFTNNRRSGSNISRKYLKWRDISDTPNGNDCFHYPSKIQNYPGLIGIGNTPLIPNLNKTGSGSGTYRDNSALLVEYTYVSSDFLYKTGVQIMQLSGIFGIIQPDRIEKLYDLEIYNIGWWVTLFEAPFPKSTHNGITEDVGEFFGGTADNKIPVLDLNNLNKAYDGLSGYANESSDTLSPLSGLHLLFNLDVTAGGRRTPQGNVPTRMTIYDTEDNVWISDKNYRFLGDTQEMIFPFSSFKIYRARTQVGFTIANILGRMINPELKILEIFEKRKVKKITFQIMTSYDDNGRYEPFTWNNFLADLFASWTGSAIKYTGIVDAFGFYKTPIVIAKDKVNSTNSVSHRHLMAPIKNYPNITNVMQLQKSVNADLDVAKHQNDLFVAKPKRGRCDLKSGYSAYIKDPNMISTSESGDNGTRLYVVQKVTYSVTENSNNAGLISDINCYRKVAT